jgi:hypothetical protein
MIALSLCGRLELEVAAEMLITQIRHLFEDVETKMSELSTIIKRLEQEK